MGLIFTLLEDTTILMGVCDDKTAIKCLKTAYPGEVEVTRGDEFGRHVEN
jgi:hypothetical protein